MKIIKFYFIAVTLLLVTVGVFALRSPLASQAIYAYNGTVAYQLDAPSNLIFLSESGSTQAEILTSLNHIYGLYYYSGGYQPLYTTGF
ncbi:MAG TPA: hypothetical protein VNS58_14290 [Puia sp.]|nr:hypothetical protein [Puia sp.]